MGDMCCGTARNYDNESQTTLSRVILNKKVQIFDISSTNYEESSLQSSIPDLSGCSQIQVSSQLYLCGSNKKNMSDSSYMYSIDLSIIPLQIKFEVNSCTAHYYPVLCNYLHDLIFVLGGEKSKKCEVYSSSLKNWRNLPDLPEEKYGGVCFIHMPEFFVYLFGGINTENGQFSTSIIRLDMPSYTKWEKITIRHNYNRELYNRAFCGVCCIGDNSNMFYVLGGIKRDEKEGKIKEDLLQKEGISDILSIEFGETACGMKIENTGICLPEKIKYNSYNMCIIESTTRNVYSYCNDDNVRKILKVNVVTGDSDVLNIVGKK